MDAELDELIARIRQRQSEAHAPLELLEDYRRRTVAEAGALESPAAVVEYIDFFASMVGRMTGQCERIAAALPSGPTREHVRTLREIASESAAQQARCSLFRDRWINRPLPQERMRPLLNEISVTTRDQLTALRDLSAVAAHLEDLVNSSPAAARNDERAFDRRALFARLFKR